MIYRSKSPIEIVTSAGRLHWFVPVQGIISLIKWGNDHYLNIYFMKDSLKRSTVNRSKPSMKVHISVRSLDDFLHYIKLVDYCLPKWISMESKLLEKTSQALWMGGQREIYGRNYENKDCGIAWPILQRHTPFPTTDIHSPQCDLTHVYHASWEDCIFWQLLKFRLTFNIS